MIVTVDGVDVDMDVSQVGISYAIGDPLEPGVIAGNRSTTFKMPATNRVRAVMGGPAMAERPISGDPVLRFQKGGTVYLEQRIRPIEWDREEVRSVSIGNNAGWFEGMKAIKLPEMDLGESGRITQALMQQSWNEEDSLLFFPIIDYGYDWETQVTPSLAEIRPGTRTHVLLKKAFDMVGYTLNVIGSLATVWRRFIIPCTTIPDAGPRTIENNTLTLIQTTPQEGGHYSPDPAFWPALPTIVDSVVDPGSTNTNTYNYTPLLNVRLKTKVTVRITPYFNAIYQFALYDVATSAPISAVHSFLLTQGGTYTRVFFLSEVDVAAGTEVGVRFSTNVDNVEVIESVQIEFIPEIEYQEDITVDINSCVPKISAWDIIQGINYSRCLAFDTDDRTKVVTVSYYDEKYRPISEGIDLVGREDHTDPPVKGSPLKPKRIVFGWKEDANDLFLERANEAAGERGWGGLIRDIEGGTLKERKIEMPFAATAMRLYPGGLLLPVMRKHDDFTPGPDHPGPEYKWVPRLLLESGDQPGSWFFDGASLSQAPNCFFVFPGETDLSMSFYPETQVGSCGPGNVAAHYGGYLRRLERSKTLSIDLMLYDQEMKGLDFGIPVQVLDDFGKGWYYFTEVKQKKFDVDEPTRCELIQV